MSEFIPKIDEVTAPKKQGEKTQEKKPSAQFWLNVGVTRKNAEGEEKLLTLPMGIPLDGLKPKPVPNKASDFQHMRLGEKQLWEQFWQYAQTLKPGESKKVQFVCEVRRVSEAEIPEDGTNPYEVGKLDFT